MCEISSGEETHSCQHTWSSLNYTQHMTECRLIHLCNSTETWWIISYEDEPRRTPHPSVRSFVYELSTGTKSVASLPQVPNTPFPELHNEENRDEVQVRLLSQCLKTLPASAEATPHSKLKPAKFSRITLLYNGWGLSLITGLFFPDKPVVIIDKSGCPLTPTQFKAHLNPIPFFSPRSKSLFVSGLYTIREHHVQSEKNLLSHSTHSLNFITKGQSLITGQNYLSEGSDSSNISLLWSMVLLDCNHPPPQETKAYWCKWSQVLTVFSFFPLNVTKIYSSDSGITE